MFTGIVSDVGTVVRLEDRGDLRARIRCGYAPEGIALGASIACDGICLTVVDRGPDGAGAWFDVDLSAETVARSNVRRGRSAWAEGRPVNLERALRLGDELGGHIVSGHVDGAGRGRRPARRGRQPAPALPRARRAGALRRAEGLGRAQRHLADRQRGRGRRVRGQPDPAHPRGHHLGRGAAGRRREPRDRHPGALRGAADRVRGGVTRLPAGWLAMPPSTRAGKS